MRELKEKLNTSIILITHDLGVVADVAERVIVMYGGQIMEEATVKELFHNPQHPYTWGLMKSIARLDVDRENEELESIEGTPPDLFNPPKGCPFAPRCEFAMKVCQESEPEFFDLKNNHYSACWLHHKDAPKIEKPRILGVK
jgi:oligopeptide transport system ATP-binding protein